MPWLRVERFGYERRRHHSAVLQLLAAVDHELGVPTDPLLLVENDAFSGAYATCASRIAMPGASARLTNSPSALLWRVEFAVSLEVVEYPQALFSVVADGRAPIALPAPHLLSGDASAANGRVRLKGARVRRHLVALAAGLAVASACGSAAGVASAATVKHPAAATVKHAAPHQTAVTKPAPETQVTARPTPKARHTASWRRTPATTHTKTPATTHTKTDPKSVASPGHNHASSPKCDPPPQPVIYDSVSGSENCHSTGPTHHLAPGHNGPHPRHHPLHHQHHHQDHHHHLHHHHPHDKKSHHTHPGSKVHHKRPHTSHGPSHHHSRATGGAAVSPAAAPSGFHLDPATVAALSQTSSLLATGNQPPAFLIPIYKAAGERYHVPWQILAAINWIETDYGTNLNTSSAGAIGWMQFMPATWRQYGVAADGRSKPNPYNPKDAVLSAAHYLAANGAALNLSEAIYAYNHATWYVIGVMRRAQIISEHAPVSADASLAGKLNLDPVALAALSRASSRHTTRNGPPAFLIPIYKAAARIHHVPGQILAAMDWTETNNGAKPDTYRPQDATFSPAQYLAANRARQNLAKAIHARNHASRHAVDVMRNARISRDHAHASTDPSLAGAGQTGLAGAVTMLLAAYSAAGGPYSQANHDSFGQTANQLRELGTDCSGFVSWVLDQVDPGFGNQTTVTLPDQPGVKPGVGHYVTMWDRPLPGDQGHVIINILGTWFESGGSTTYNPAGGIVPMSQAQAVGQLAAGGFRPYQHKGL